jgi:hypothetical protein
MDFIANLVTSNVAPSSIPDTNSTVLQFRPANFCEKLKVISMETLVISECKPILFTSGKDGTVDYGTGVPVAVF